MKGRNTSDTKESIEQTARMSGAGKMVEALAQKMRNGRNNETHAWKCVWCGMNYPYDTDKKQCICGGDLVLSKKSCII